MTSLPTPTPEQIQSAQAMLAKRIQETAANAVASQIARTKPLLDVYLVAESVVDGRAEVSQLADAVRQARVDMARIAAGVQE